MDELLSSPEQIVQDEASDNVNNNAELNLYEEDEELFDEEEEELAKKVEAAQRKLRIEQMKEELEATNRKLELIREGKNVKSKSKNVMKESKNVMKAVFGEEEEDVDDDGSEDEEIFLGRGKSKFRTLKRGQGRNLDSRIVNRQLYPEDWLGPELLNLDQEIDFNKLTLRLLMIGETNICLNGGLDSKTSKARLAWLTKLGFYAGRYEWHAVLQLHKSVLKRIEFGYASWNSEFASLAVELCSAFPIRKNYKGNEKWEKKDNKFDRSEKQVFYCGAFNKAEGCEKTDKHSTMYKNSYVVAHHICSSCWSKQRIRANHSAVSGECPNNM